MAEKFSGKKVLVSAEPTELARISCVSSFLAIRANSRSSRISLSADPVNVTDDSRVRLVVGSITDDRILRDLDDDLDYAYHLACFHGNQSSIHNPLLDHENNTLNAEPVRAASAFSLFMIGSNRQTSCTLVRAKPLF
jgi:UDP-glucose 4-epimerase